MIKSLIIGAGSIGNHLANAARTRGWSVSIFDIDNNAMNRMKNDIYPSRYGRWDSSIRFLKDISDAKINYDVIFIGTPPDTHLVVAKKVLKYHSPKILFIEKPLCQPDSEIIKQFSSIINKKQIKCVVGYNHNLTKNTEYAKKLIREGNIIGKPLSLNVNWQEHWDGIFKAHPWLDGPKDSYLGYSYRGGGATGEHSHGIALWLYFAEILDFGKLEKVSSVMNMFKKNDINYDQSSNISFITNNGYSGSVTQDVISSPENKIMKIQGSDGFINWHANYDNDNDAVVYGKNNSEIKIIKFKKKRSDDFLNEIIHLEYILNGEMKNNIISFDRALLVMRVILSSYKSNKELKSISIY